MQKGGQEGVHGANGSMCGGHRWCGGACVVVRSVRGGGECVRERVSGERVRGP